MNRLLGQSLSVTTPRPGTTRMHILGVQQIEDPPTQIAWMDTPGVARPKTALHQQLVQEASHAMENADCILLMDDCTDRGFKIQRSDPRRPKPSPEALQSSEAGDGPEDGDTIGKSSPETDPAYHVRESRAARILRQLTSSNGDSSTAAKPIVVAINKVDELGIKDYLLPRMSAWQAYEGVRAVVPVSALKGTQLDSLVKEVRKCLPEGMPYDPEMWTNRSERFFVCEHLRGSVMRQIRAEIPYGVAVYLDHYEEQDRLTRIQASIVVEKASHKGILIGKGGLQLKAIGTEARKAMETMLGKKVHLEVWVKVVEGWTRDPRRVRELLGSETAVQP